MGRDICRWGKAGGLHIFSQVFFYLLWTQQRGIYADEVGFVKCFQVFPLWFCLNTQISVSNPRQSQRVKLNQRQIFRLNFLNWRKFLTKLPNLFDKIPICIWFCTLQVQDKSWNSISGQFWTQFCINTGQQKMHKNNLSLSKNAFWYFQSSPSCAWKLLYRPASAYYIRASNRGNSHSTTGIGSFWVSLVKINLRALTSWYNVQPLSTSV